MVRQYVTGGALLVEETGTRQYVFGGTLVQETVSTAPTRKQARYSYAL